ncbi:hypothetical protein CAC42_3421 [Sphaceloma murrayae]|uniref:Zn(2)-C6 fungal-type domain-containing protein n=1 Tax=Sphaceloma murrayae TaxID=2082308 RepID=A0A2K1R1B3_9PEZI|nr:hypothetical protein CAC42_3421 [Sphaceloma murrayae]
MASRDERATGRPAPTTLIAPAPPDQYQASGAGLGANGRRDREGPLMPYTCQTCTKRKVKCDKTSPACSSCRKGKLECLYQAPAPRQRKRKLSGGPDDKLRRYEQLLRQHGLLPSETEPVAQVDDEALEDNESYSLRLFEPATSKTGKLVAHQGKSRYIDSSLWRSLGDDDIQNIADEDEEDHLAHQPKDEIAPDPVTGAFLGMRKNLLHYHPSPSQAQALWKTHTENVEPLCKILHIPTTARMVESLSRQPALASHVDECLLFAIYHFAVFTMTESECLALLDQPKESALKLYHAAARQALVNASFLKTTEITVLQAFLLLLIPSRRSFDPQTYWVLTGVAVRVAQRMGLHRDGEALGLPPFELQMRRRIFFQLLRVEGHASQVSGVGIGMLPDTWDTKPPLNVNDSQIWPGMVESPVEQKGATEMIYFLTRASVGVHFIAMGPNANFKDYHEAEPRILRAETEIEERFLRYCDIADPVHFLTMGIARAAISAMRLRARLPRVRKNLATAAEKRDIFALSLKIIDIDVATHQNYSLRKFLWYTRDFFAHGTWDALIFVFNSLRKPDFLTPSEIASAWSKLEQIYLHHSEFLEMKGALQVAMGRLLLKAWDARPSHVSLAEPTFIVALRGRQEASARARTRRLDSGTTTISSSVMMQAPPDLVPNFPASDLSAAVSDAKIVGNGDDFNLDEVDWVFWDQLIKDYQSQGG